LHSVKKPKNILQAEEENSFKSLSRRKFEQLNSPTPYLKKKDKKILVEKVARSKAKAKPSNFYKYINT